MNASRILQIGTLAIWLLNSCNTDDNQADAYGNFEAVEYIISAENTGKIMHLDVEEGDVFSKATQVGIIDTIQLFFQREQLKAMRKSTASGIRNILSRIAVFEEQKSLMEKDRSRIEQMFKDGAATQKDIDDNKGQIQVVEKQIKAVKTENAKVLGQLESIDQQIKALNDQIHKSRIFVPGPATVLEKYREAYEMTTPGMPLFKLANLQTLDLRVYVSGDQLSEIKLGQQVEVVIDKDEGNYHVMDGELTWISSQSEFTPKIIQTRKERVKQVYAVKVKVKNDGSLKIGMPGEIRFRNK